MISKSNLFNTTHLSTMPRKAPQKALRGVLPNPKAQAALALKVAELRAVAAFYKGSDD